MPETPADDGRGDWGSILDELDRRRAHARSMGGPERVERHRSRGKLDARQRLGQLFDPGTFVEIGAFVGTIPPPGQPDAPADGLVAGMGTINGRPAVAGAEDFTVLGGSIG